MCDFSKSLKEELMYLADKAREHSYAPYSNYHVGACLIADNGKLYSGANIENGSYGASICAERVAIFKAIYDGAKVIEAIAIKADTPRAFPCGICRQVMSEFAGYNKNTEKTENTENIENTQNTPNIQNTLNITKSKNSKIDEKTEKATKATKVGRAENEIIDNIKIFVEGENGEIEEYDLEALFPHAFELKKMES